MGPHKALSEPRDGVEQSVIGNEGREGKRCQGKCVGREGQGSTTGRKGEMTRPALNPAGH